MDAAKITNSGDALKPGWPRAGGSAAIFRGAHVLLVERKHGPLAGLWSLPGGLIEAGETVRAATLREIREETGIEAELLTLVDVHDVLLRTGEELAAHYVLVVFAGRWISGEPIPASDAAAALFVPLGDLDAYRLTEGAQRLITRAWEILLVEEGAA
jgi:8-oxo-dGTP diphosphatase